MPCNLPSSHTASNNALNLKEIGAVLGVTESRVCQIRNQAMHRIQSQLLVEYQD